MAYKNKMRTDESLLSMIPKTSIIEIEEIRDEMKNHNDNQFWIFYSSKLSTAAGKIIRKLSRGYADLFKRVYDDYIVVNNPFEDASLGIIRNQDRIVKAWNAVETKMSYLRKGLEDMKKSMVPIIESKTFEETVKAINKIPYDAKYFLQEGGFHRSPYKKCVNGIVGHSVIFPKREFETFVVNMLNEMCIYEEKYMLIEIVPIIRNIINIIDKTRRVEKDNYMKKYPELYKGSRIDIHNNATGHITVGLISIDTINTLNKIKLLYPDI